MAAVPELNMKPLPSLDPSRRSMGSYNQTGINWSASTGNVEDAKLAVQALRALIDDAVYLDENAYVGAAKIAAYTAKIQAQARRIRELDLEVAAVQAEVAAKDKALAAAAARQRELISQAAGLQEELDNSTVVFKMHYQELITRNEEITRLNGLVASLQAQLQQVQHFPPAPMHQGGTQQQPQPQPSAQQQQQVSGSGTRTPSIHIPVHTVHSQPTPAPSSPHALPPPPAPPPAPSAQQSPPTFPTHADEARPHPSPQPPQLSFSYRPRGEQLQDEEEDQEDGVPHIGQLYQQPQLGDHSQLQQGGEEDALEPWDPAHMDF